MHKDKNFYFRVNAFQKIPFGFILKNLIKEINIYSSERLVPSNVQGIGENPAWL